MRTQKLMIKNGRQGPGSEKKEKIGRDYKRNKRQASYPVVCQDNCMSSCGW